MSTSGTATFSTTRNNVIRDALHLLGVIESNASPEPEDLQFCGRFLDMLIKQWAPRMNIWPTKDVTVTLTPGTTSYEIKSGSLVINEPRPLAVISARRRDTAGNETPMDVVSREEYMAIPTKTTQAPAIMVYYDRQRTDGTLYFWPTGSTGNVTVICTLKRALEDVGDEGDEPDFPQEGILGLVYNLAAIVSPAYGGLRQDVAAVALQLKQELLDDDTEGTPLYITPRFN